MLVQCFHIDISYRKYRKFNPGVSIDISPVRIGISKRNIAYRNFKYPRITYRNYGLPGP